MPTNMKMPLFMRKKATDLFIGQRRLIDYQQPVVTVKQKVSNNAIQTKLDYY